METGSKLTPALKRWLAFIADGGERGRMELQITASGGRAGSQLQALRQAGYVEYVPAPFVTRGRFEPDRVRVTEAGRKALVAAAAKEPITYCRDDDRYIVYLGDERIGFVRRETPPDGYAPDGRWKAVDIRMAWTRWFKTRGDAAKALLRRHLATRARERR
jgi:hypothetical protein